MATIMQTLAEHGSFNDLVDALSVTSLDEMLEGGNYTLFAPTDAAFAKLPPGVLDDLTQDLERFREILKHHIVEGSFTVDRLMQNSEINVLYGNPLPLKPTKGADVSIASFGETDIECDNGFIHAIDTVLQPATELATPFGSE